jgi:protocatechuate 3,4-dioxygenase beta subunit
MFKLSLSSVRMLLAGCLLLAACTDNQPAPTTDQNPDKGDEKDTPYAVSGTVVDTQGKPMAGVKVRADNDALYGSAEVTTDAKGRYKLPKLELAAGKSTPGKK